MLLTLFQKNFVIQLINFMNINNDEEIDKSIIRLFQDYYY